MNKILIYIMTIGATLFFFSCQKEYEAGNTNAEPLAGEWYVKYYENGASISNYWLLYSSNTNKNSNSELYVTNKATTANGSAVAGFAPFGVVTGADMNSKMFSISGSPNVFYYISGSNVITYSNTISILDGKMVEKVSHLPSGNLADSIHFKIEFSDKPGHTYEVSGFRRSGFTEDEPH